MSTEYIFVYGSLRRHFASPARRVLDDHAEFVGEATFRGKLYMIDWYPGVVESDSPEDGVAGEVYRIIHESSVLSKLDHYEGYSADDPTPHEFERKEKPVQLTNGDEIVAWIYVYVFPTSGKEQIHSGDYVTFNSKL